MYRIRIIGDDVLRKVAREVTEFDESLHNLAHEMLDIMHDRKALVWLHLRSVCPND